MEYAAHGGKVVDFHGWGLPLHFRGIIEEHGHVRGHAGIFDCSHMGEFYIRGSEGIAALSDLVIGNLVALSVGKCRYTTLLNDQGCIIDDCVALKLAEDEMLLITNAGALDTVVSRLDGRVQGLENISDATAKIDVQGPASLQVMAALGFSGIDRLAFWTGTRTAWQGYDMIVARAGYTGELGYELYLPNEAAPTVWRALASHPEVLPCGLGARDTLRTEMGYPLSGQDVSIKRTPLEASLDRFIAWDTPFPGKAILKTQREAGNYSVLTALRSPDRRAPRHGYSLMRHGNVVGEVTSGGYGPSIECGVGLGYVPRALAIPGTELCAGPREMKLFTEQAPLYKHASGRNPITANLVENKQ
jgi:aminomethyltransferase